jgi:DNA-binding NtrC family response regulator
MTFKRKMNSVLVVDDNADVRMTAHFLLSDHGYEVIEAESPAQAQMSLKNRQFDFILLDMNFTKDTTSGSEGLAFLDWLEQAQVSASVIVMTAWSSIELAVRAMQKGAKDFVEKPWENQRLLHVLEQQAKLSLLEKENRALKALNKIHNTSDELVVKSQAMNELMRKLSKLAQSDATILLTGENGTGKSCVAKFIHDISTRNEQAFVSVNMGAIPANLFESELFGHTKGAFTDAKSQREGRFELANSGTLFLDEIANIPLEQQAKLLRVLESGEFERVGSSKTQQADVRLVCATNADLEAMIQAGTFRADLYFRLNTIEITIPSLKNRAEDILPLCEHFLQKHAAKYAREGLYLSAKAKSKLKCYLWPGNVRELSHVIERSVLLAEDKEISDDDILIKQSTAMLGVSSQARDEEFGEEVMTLEQGECQLIKTALIKTMGNINESAKLLGVSASSLYRKMEKFNINKFELGND